MLLNIAGGVFIVQYNLENEIEVIVNSSKVVWKEEVQ